MPFHEWIFPDGTKWAKFYRIDKDCVSFHDLGDFVVSADGCTVRAWPAPEISEDTMQHLYLNQVLPLAHSANKGELSSMPAPLKREMVPSRFSASLAAVNRRWRRVLRRLVSVFLTDDALLLDPANGGYLVQPSLPIG